MNVNDLIQEITQDEWVEMAKLANTTPQQFKNEYKAFLADNAEGLQEIEVTVGTLVTAANGCKEQSFDVSLGKGLSIEGRTSFCKNSSGWNATLHVALNYKRKEIGARKYKLSMNNSEVSYKVSNLLIKLHLEIGIKGSKHCLYLKGGFHIRFVGGKDVDKKVYCFD